MKKILEILIFLIVVLPHPAGAMDISYDPAGAPYGKTMHMAVELMVYPNPVFQKQFTVELHPGNITGITITNIAGRQVFDRAYPSSGNRVTIQTNDIPDGIYFLKVKATNNISKTVKLIIRSKN